MIVTRLNGGLGNQLFQYAMGRRTAEVTGQTLKLDTEKFKTCSLRNYRLIHFNIEATIATQEDKRRLHILRRQDPLALFHYLLDKLRPAHLRRIIRETNFHFQPALRNINGPAYLDGDWQSPEYFKGAEGQLRREFTLCSPLDHQDCAAEQEIQATNHSVAIHIRRGDLVSDPTSNEIHGTVSMDYYNRAIEELLQKLNTPKFFLFSDDPKWAIQNLPKEKIQLRPIDHNGPEKDYADLHLMSQCQHHIIANSTFSWWGAWLARKPNKRVFYPTPWFKNSPNNTTDLFPVEWETI